MVPDYFATALKKLPMLYDEEYVDSGVKEIDSQKEYPYSEYPELVMP